jgi:hypothetical protein
MIERGRGARDEVAMCGAIRDERIGVLFIDKSVDEVVVLFELIGECGRSACEREARCECCQPADQPQ